MNRLFVTLLLLLVTSSAQSVGASARESPREGKVKRDGFELYYTVVGSGGPYALILSGGPGEEVRSMQPVADELRACFRSIVHARRASMSRIIAT